MSSGCLYGVGLGPGDPELMTLKAARILGSAQIVAWFSKGGKRSHAHTIAAAALNASHEEMPLIYPVTTEFPVGDPEYDDRIHDFYETAAAQIGAKLAAGRDVAVLCAGDPFFYGSFMHLYWRLADTYPCQVVPGVTAMSGGWTNAGAPITWGDDILTVLPGTLEGEKLAAKLAETDAAVIMKLGRNLPKVRQALARANLLDRAVYVQYGTMKAEKIMKLADKPADDAPYFSLIFVPGRGRRL